MTLQSVLGQRFYIPTSPLVGSGGTFPAISSIAVDAAAETIHFVGHVSWADGAASKAVGTGGGGLRWNPGAVTFAAAAGGSVLNVGLQTVDLTAGPSARASSSTPAIYKALVSATDTITANTWRTDSFGTGSISDIANGDLIAVLFNMSARTSPDSVSVRGAFYAGNTSYNMPVVTLETSGPTYTQQALQSNCIIVATDGTLGWLDGAFTWASISNNAINNGSAIKEYANVFRVPFACQVDGFYAGMTPASSADFTLSLYSDPLNAGAGVTSMASVAVDANTLGSTNGRNVFVSFATQQTLAINTDYAVAIKPDTANNVTVPWWSVNNTAEWVAHGLGTNCYMASRGTVGSTTAFTSVASGVQRAFLGLRVYALDDGASAGGGVIGGPNKRAGMQ